MDITNTSAVSSYLTTVSSHINEWDGGSDRWNRVGTDVLENMYDPESPDMVVVHEPAGPPPALPSLDQQAATALAKHRLKKAEEQRLRYSTESQKGALAMQQQFEERVRKREVNAHHSSKKKEQFDVGIKRRSNRDRDRSRSPRRQQRPRDRSRDRRDFHEREVTNNQLGEMMHGIQQMQYDVLERMAADHTTLNAVLNQTTQMMQWLGQFPR
jgi:hypothetical protein